MNQLFCVRITLMIMERLKITAECSVCIYFDSKNYNEVGTMGLSKHKYISIVTYLSIHYFSDESNRLEK